MRFIVTTIMVVIGVLGGVMMMMAMMVVKGLKMSPGRFGLQFHPVMEMAFGGEMNRDEVDVEGEEHGGEQARPPA